MLGDTVAVPWHRGIIAFYFALGMGSHCLLLACRDVASVCMLRCLGVALIWETRSYWSWPLSRARSLLHHRLGLSLGSVHPVTVSTFIWLHLAAQGSLFDILCHYFIYGRLLVVHHRPPCFAHSLVDFASNWVAWFLVAHSFGSTILSPNFKVNSSKIITQHKKMRFDLRRIVATSTSRLICDLLHLWYLRTGCYRSLKTTCCCR